MSGNIVKILLAVAIFCIMTTAVEAYAMADSFRNPLDSYVISDGYRFGQYLWSSTYHTGEDLKASPTTPVYAIANGQVKEAKEGAQGYAQVVVIEHTLPDNSKVVSIYGHLSKRAGYKITVSKGQDVAKGKLIGYVGYDDENGDGGPHLHFGIRKGEYISGLYEGRTSLSGLSNFNKPSDYLNLIRAVNTPEAYRLANLGNKIWIPSADTFNSCKWNWNDIRPVSITERNNHPTSSGASCFAAGTFIKRADNPEISLIKSYQDTSTIQNRFRHPFGSWDAFLRYGGKADLSNVRIVSYSEYYTHTQGKTLT